MCVLNSVSAGSQLDIFCVRRLKMRDRVVDPHRMKRISDD